jgi:hypothetical protein
MARKKKYAINFRLSATVELTEKEMLMVVNGDSSPIKTKLKRGDIDLGGGDSYWPGCWLTDDDKLPQTVKDAFRESGASDVEIFV